MRFRSACSILLCAGAAAFFFLPAQAAGPGEIKLEAFLVWGANDAKSPNPNYKPVPPDLAKKIRQSFKWEYYFEVNRTNFDLSKSQEKTVRMSKNCELTVKNLGDSQLSLRLIGKGKPVHYITRPLPKDEVFIYGGNAENSTAWFLVLRQAE
jgi:hypothetical protein